MAPRTHTEKHPPLPPSLSPPLTLSLFLSFSLSFSLSLSLAVSGHGNGKGVAWTVFGGEEGDALGDVNLISSCPGVSPRVSDSAKESE